jgi:hypothetical protein
MLSNGFVALQQGKLREFEQPLSMIQTASCPNSKCRAPGAAPIIAIGLSWSEKMGFGKIVGAAILFGALGAAAASQSAAAYVICNGEGDCWHSERVEQVPGMNFEIHPDDWYFHQEWGRYRRFHEYHDGRGYWHKGVWVEL